MPGDFDSCPLGMKLEQLCRDGGWRFSIYWDAVCQAWYVRAQKGDGHPLLTWSKECHREALRRMFGAIDDYERGPGFVGGA